MRCCTFCLICVKHHLSMLFISQPLQQTCDSMWPDYKQQVQSSLFLTVCGRRAALGEEFCVGEKPGQDLGTFWAWWGHYPPVVDSQSPGEEGVSSSDVSLTHINTDAAQSLNISFSFISSKLLYTVAWIKASVSCKTYVYYVQTSCIVMIRVF